MHRALAWGAPEFVLTRSQWVPGELAAVAAFFAEPRNLQRITPGWLGFRLTHMEPDEVRRGTLITYRMAWMGIPYRWRTLIEQWEPGRSFVDLQVNGPYILWRHTHTFEAEGGGVRLSDEVRYRVPFGPIGVILHRLMIRRQVEGIFDYRVARIREIFGG